jgi:hypothetical protein
MKVSISYIFALTLFCILFSFNASAEKKYPDTVQVGIYMTSIHDVDFKEKEYSLNLWLWLKYKRAEFDFMKYLEIPMAKTFEKSYAIVDTLEDSTIYMLMKLQCVMKGTWRITHFPFDRQRLRFSIENSNFDASELVFAADTVGNHYGQYFLTGWEKDSFNIKTDIKKYETAFGDPTYDEPRSEYGTYRATIVVHRESWELFFKLFLGMYISFLISFVCFYIHPDNMDSRLALSVGSLFAVIGNKYIIDSTLPEASTFTLVDTLHGITLFYIFLVIASSVFTLKLIKNNKRDKATLYNKIAGSLLLILYVLLNFWFISNAVNSQAAG